MNNSKKFGIMLAAGALLATLPLMAGVFKKQITGKTLDISERQRVSVSPKKHAVPEKSEAAADGVRLRGLVVNGDKPYIGEFTIGDDGLNVSNIYSNRLPEGSGGAVYAEGKFYINDIYEESLGCFQTAQIIYDANTWKIIERREDLDRSSAGMCMTYDPFDCAVYGYFLNSDNDDNWFGFGRLNLATGETYQYNSVDSNEAFMCIAASPDGYIYGVDVNGQYCRINKSNGVVTVLGHTDVKPHYVQSATIDWKTGTFYWAAMTDVGESILYSIDPETYIAKEIGHLPQNQEFIGLYVAEEPVPEKTPAKVSELEVRLDKDNLSGKISFTAPVATSTGTSLSGKMTAYAAVDGQNFKIETTAGQPCEIPFNVSGTGLYIFTIWVASGDTQGEKSTIQRWIGPDVPTKATDLVCTKTNDNIVLTWTGPSEVGQHGGYVDTDKVTYVIGREEGPRMNQIHDYIGTTFEQPVPQGYAGKLSYYVRPVNQELAGPITYSNTIMIGNAVHDVPCHLSLMNEDECVYIDANKDGKTWKATMFGYISCNSPADDWILSPVVALSAGTIYTIKYEAGADMGYFSPQSLEVKAGIGNNVDAMTISIAEETVSALRLNNPDEFSAEFTVPVDGNYRIGFHNKTQGGGAMALYSFDIKTAGATSGPVAPTQCKVTPALEGRLSATIGFTSPTKYSNGNTLEALDRIEVLRGGAIVGTVNNPEPGKNYSVVDDNALQGENTWQICAYSSSNAKGLTATVSGWVGLDIPGIPGNVKMTSDGNVITISWELPESGIHNGYVKKEDVIYSIFDPMYYIELLSVKGVETVKIDLGELTKQSVIQLALQTMNEAGVNNQAALTPTIVAGPSYQLPFFETFSNGRVNHSWSQVGGYDDDEVGWSPVEDKGPDGESGVSTFVGYIPEDVQALRSRKVSLIGSNAPKLRFYLYGEKNANATFTVDVSEEFDGNYTPVYTSNFLENEADGSWVPVEIDLTQYVGKEIFFQFKATPRDPIVIGIDDISIRSSVDYDASIEDIKLDKADVEVGVTTASVKVRVQNHGVKDIREGSYSVVFYADDRQFASLPGETMKASFGQSVYTTEFIPVMDDKDPVKIWSKIISDYDEYAQNNKSKEVSLNIDKVICPIVDDLEGTIENGKVELKWSEPDQSGLPVRSVTDDFSAYRNFSINHAGEWTIIDSDKAPGVRTSYFFPGSTGAIGWMVLDPFSIPSFAYGTLGEKFPAYSGEKYMVAFGPSDGDNDDWLITPELSGKAQEISFMARAESSRAGREMFEVYYSKTGNTVEDMIRLDNTDWRTSLSGWEEFRFKVPEGTKYFAVRCVSHNRLAMHIDEFKYESAATPLKVKLVGYNVYRNDEKLNKEVLTTTTFTDDLRGNDEVIYTVRVVYDRCESQKGNEVKMNSSSINEIYNDIDLTTTPVYDLQGRRVMHLIEGEIYVTKNRTFIYRSR